jgi:hypothetical protein
MDVGAIIGRAVDQASLPELLETIRAADISGRGGRHQAPSC